MKKRIILLLGFILLFTIMVACAQEEEPLPELTVDMIDVKISTEPQRIYPGEPVKIIAKVTLHGEPVEADRVIFEIWEGDERRDAEHIDGTREDVGVYSTMKEFATEGVYYAISHVDYGIMHNMPMLKLVVGDVPGEDPNQQQIEQDGNMMMDMNMN